MSPRTVFIYTLRDSGTGEVRYVGQTVDPRSRLAGHRKRRRETPVSRWIAKMDRRGAYPIMDVVDSAPTCERATLLECGWIRYGRTVGWRLLNVLTSGRTYTEEFALRASRRAMAQPSSFAGRRHTEETRAKMRESRLRNPPPRTGPHAPETREKMRATAWSRSTNGKAFSPEHRSRISAAKMGHEVAPETRAKIAASLRARAATARKG